MPDLFTETETITGCNIPIEVLLRKFSRLNYPCYGHPALMIVYVVTQYQFRCSLQNSIEQLKACVSSNPETALNELYEICLKRGYL